MARLHSVTTYRNMPLQDGWELVSTTPGSYQSPEQLEHEEQQWLTASVPGTVVDTLRQHQQWDLAHPHNVDAQDYWYRCSFASPLPEPGVQTALKFAGLATVAEVWLNGRCILSTDTMFRAYEVDVTPDLRAQNTLYIHFIALHSLLAKKRPRPHWRTQLVDHQQLRWLRTTLLGRMPGWSPPVQTVGPWRAVSLEERHILAIEHTSLQTSIQGTDGYVSVALKVRGLTGQLPEQALFVIDGKTFPLQIQVETNGVFACSGEARVPDVRLWWPHTHGDQDFYEARLVLYYPTMDIELACGRLAFRQIELLDASGEQFGLRVNGVPIFCRGACWTPLDIYSLSGSYQAYQASLQTAQAAGLNMLRVGGTMVYEDDAFYELCDELGILVWQDFMFANMDYPTTDAAFLANCRQECEQVLQRLQTHPCLAVLCGNSEIQQQVAMLGLSQEVWQNAFFEQDLPVICQTYVDVPYWISSPSGGVLPFQANVGNAHYQGVGPFLRPLEDARRSEVRFASECLGFAHVPEDRTLDFFLSPAERVVHHPKWKARTPRDTGSTWDFEDIRDYYLKLLFEVDPLKLRYSDMERYLDLSRVTTGEVVASVFAEWRRQRSVCNGGLIWFYRDLWPGAGWGIVDSTGYPKAVYYYLRRVSLPQACFFMDEGVNGLYLHAANDREAAFPVTLQLSLYRYTGTLMATVTKDIVLSPREVAEIHVDALFAHFQDLTYAYRFGPPGYDLAVATLVDPQTTRQVSEAFYFPQGLLSTREGDLGLSAQAIAQPDGTYTLTIRAAKFAQSIAIRVDNYLPEDNYFHLQPGGERVVALLPSGKQNKLRGFISALNTYNEIPITL